MTVTVRAGFRVTGDLDAFLDVVAQLVEQSSREPGTLRYDWFHGDAPGTFVVLEEYVDDDAAAAHGEGSADRIARAHALAELTELRVHGDVGPRLAGMIADIDVARVHAPLRWGDIHT